MILEESLNLSNLCLFIGKRKEKITSFLKLLLFLRFMNKNDILINLIRLYVRIGSNSLNNSTEKINTFKALQLSSVGNIHG